MYRGSFCVVIALCVMTSLVLTAQAQAAGAGSAGGMYLQDGRYRGVLVAVDQAVEFSEEVLSHLKEYIRRASEALYIATSPVSARSFGEVSILLSRSWPSITGCKSVSTENHHEAHFIVEKDTTLWGSNPHTQKIDSQCGNPGKVTYLPRSFVVDLNEARKYGDNIGKTILHEWGHLRYGLFDELEEVNDPTTCIKYDGVTKPIKCSTEVQGVVQEDGETCSFYPHLNQPEGVKASVMYLQYLDSVDTFCNKTGAGITHNSDAQNPQNDRCDGRSAWEVMMEHPDFKLHKESATGHDVNIQCVQETDMDRMVLVMDVSGSMREDHRLLRMQQDVRLFLQSLPCRDTSIGMVEFSGNMTQAKITHQLARLDSDSNLDTLIGAIPQATLDKTCIGCGIKRAIELVETSGRTVNGTVIVIFTDGLENEHPSIQEVTADVLARGMVVYSVMLMSQARVHPLIKLSSQTGGRSCTFADNQHTTYYDCLNSILHHRSPLTAPNQMVSRLIHAPLRKSVSGTVVIDARPGEDLAFTVTWSSDYLAGCEDTRVVITSPTGAVIDQHSTDKYNYNYRLRTITMEVVADEDSYKAGVWSYLIDNYDFHSDCVCRLRVEAWRHIEDCSQSILDTDLPIIILPTVSESVSLDKDKDPLDNAVKLYVEVSQGGNAVINATVIAEIESDTGKTWTIVLLDNGIGADLNANDGTYSRYFTDFDGDGTYSVKFKVVGDSNTKIQVGSTTIKHLAAPIMPNYTYNANDIYQPIDNFTRVTVGGIFEVYNYDKITTDGTGVTQLLFPPDKITSFSLKFDRETGTIMLKWRAVGEYLDQGQASSYDVRWNTSADHLRNNFDNSQQVTDSNIIEGTITQAKPVGEEELLKLSASSMGLVENQIYYLAVKTVNSNNLVSPVSNVVVFQFLQPIKSTATPSTTKATDRPPSSSKPATLSTESKTIASSSPPSAGDQNVYVSTTLSSLQSTTTSEADESHKAVPTWVYYVIAALGAALLLTILIVCMVCCSRHSGGKSQSDNLGFTNPDRMVVLPDGVSLEVIDPTGGGSDQEPDLIKEINEKAPVARPRGVKHSTWPVSKVSKKKEKKKRGNIFRSIGKSQFVTEIKKRLSHNKSSEKLDDKQWTTPCEPLQDHPYSNPLFGHAVMVPEIQIHNAVIQQQVALPDSNGDGTSSLYERRPHHTSHHQQVNASSSSATTESTVNLYDSRLSLQ